MRSTNSGGGRRGLRIRIACVQCVRVGQRSSRFSIAVFVNTFSFIVNTAYVDLLFFVHKCCDLFDFHEKMCAVDNVWLFLNITNTLNMIETLNNVSIV